MLVVDTGIDDAWAIGLAHRLARVELRGVGHGRDGLARLVAPGRRPDELALQMLAEPFEHRLRVAAPRPYPPADVSGFSL